MRLSLWFASVALLVAGPAVSMAGQVSIEGTHLCCGACVKAVNASLGKVEGVSNVAVDSDAGTVKYDATDAQTATAGVNALAEAGFAGKAKHDGKPVNFPKGVKTEGTANTVTINGIHNCCPGCANAIEGALKGVKGVTAVKCEKKSCTVTGTDVSYTALIQALQADGFHGTIAAQ